jgi:hypothetical protein
MLWRSRTIDSQGQLFYRGVMTIKINSEIK